MAYQPTTCFCSLTGPGGNCEFGYYSASHPNTMYTTPAPAAPTVTEELESFFAPAPKEVPWPTWPPKASNGWSMAWLESISPQNKAEVNPWGSTWDADLEVVRAVIAKIGDTFWSDWASIWGDFTPIHAMKNDHAGVRNILSQNIPRLREYLVGLAANEKRDAMMKKMEEARDPVRRAHQEAMVRTTKISALAERERLTFQEAEAVLAELGLKGCQVDTLVAMQVFSRYASENRITPTQAERVLRRYL